MKLSELKKTALQAEATKEVEYAAGWRLTLRPITSREYEHGFQSLLRKKMSVRRGFRRSSLSPEVMEDLQKEALARFSIISWEGLNEEDGTEIPYTWQKALEIMQECRDIFKFVQEEATFFADQEEDFLEESEKN